MALGCLVRVSEISRQSDEAVFRKNLLGIVALGLAERGWFYMAVWLGCDFLILGIAHGRGSHRVFGKQTDGTLPLWSWLLFSPLLIYTTAVWHLMSLVSREPACSVVIEQLVVGRRLLACECDDEFDNFVDLLGPSNAPIDLLQANEIGMLFIDDARDARQIEFLIHADTHVNVVSHHANRFG